MVVLVKIIKFKVIIFLYFDDIKNELSVDEDNPLDTAVQSFDEIKDEIGNIINGDPIDPAFSQDPVLTPDQIESIKDKIEDLLNQSLEGKEIKVEYTTNKKTKEKVVHKVTFKN